MYSSDPDHTELFRRLDLIKNFRTLDPAAKLFAVEMIMNNGWSWQRAFKRACTMRCPLHNRESYTPPPPPPTGNTVPALPRAVALPLTLPPAATTPGATDPVIRLPLDGGDSISVSESTLRTVINRLQQSSTGTLPLLVETPTGTWTGSAVLRSTHGNVLEVTFETHGSAEVGDPTFTTTIPDGGRRTSTEIANATGPLEPADSNSQIEADGNGGSSGIREQPVISTSGGATDPTVTQGIGQADETGSEGVIANPQNAAGQSDECS